MIVKSNFYKLFLLLQILHSVMDMTYIVTGSLTSCHSNQYSTLNFEIQHLLTKTSP